MSCSDCYKGHFRTGAPRGREATVHGLPTYISEPEVEQPKGLIVIAPDAFGWTTNHTRLNADAYARHTGCRVYVPHFMNGDSAPVWLPPILTRLLDETGFVAWLAKPWLFIQTVYGFLPFHMRNSPPKCLANIKRFMNDFRCDEGKDTKIGFIGFCWGGYAATKLAHGDVAANGQLLIDASFTAHPSALTIPADIDGIRIPYSVSIGDVDFALPKAELEKMVVSLDKNKDVDSEVVVIPGAKHGFATRYDQKNKEALAMAEKAEDQMARWFAKHL